MANAIVGDACATVAFYLTRDRSLDFREGEGLPDQVEVALRGIAENLALRIVDEADRAGLLPVDPPEIGEPFLTMLRLDDGAHIRTAEDHASAATARIQGAIIEGEGVYQGRRVVGSYVRGPGVVEERRALILSTAHLAQETDRFLSTTPIEGWPIAGGYTGVGYYLHADTEPGADMPKELAAACAYAVRHGFDYLQFDRDAEAIPDLRTFDWS